MAAHVLGKGDSHPCPNSSAAAQNAARTVRNAKGKGKRGLEESSTDDDVDNDQKSKPAKKKLLTKIERSFTQSQLKILRGIEVPFNSEQADIVHEQFLRATISANLPFRWVEDCHYSCSSDPLQPMSCPHVTKFLAHFSTVPTTG